MNETPVPGEPYPQSAGDRLDSHEGDRAGTDKALELEAAVSLARQGHAAGWTALFDRFHPTVYGYALARLGRPAIAEDIAQEVFVSAVRSIGALRDTRTPVVQAWFLRICRNKIVDHLRHDKLETAIAQDTGMWASAPADDIDQRVGAEELRAALHTLTDDQRDVLIRRFILDQSLETVALATRRSRGSVKSLQHRALAALNKLLGEGGP